MRAIKWALGVFAGLILLAVAGVAIFLSTFDANAYKSQIAEAVKQSTGRTLTVDGSIGLTVFPKLGASVEKVALSEPQGTKTFARIDEARVALALWPLLSRRVVVDRIILSGLAVDLVRDKNGRTNFDDLTGTAKPGEKPADKKPGDPSGPPLAIDVGGIVLKNASIGWRDEGDGTDVRLSNVNLTVGRIASNVPAKMEFAAKIDGTQPQASVQVNLESGYRLNLESGAAALSGLSLKAIGSVPGLAGLDARFKGDTVDLDPKAQRVTLSGVQLTVKSTDGLDATFSIPWLQVAPDKAESKPIAGELTLARPDQKIGAKLALSALEATGRDFRFARLAIDLDVKSGNLGVQGTIGMPVALNLDRQQAQLPAIAGDLVIKGPEIPGGAIKAALTGALLADWGARNANVELALKMDDSNIQAKTAVVNWAQPAITFDLVADRLDIDRYFPPAKPGAAPPGAPSGGSGGGPPAEKPIDLSALETLNAKGTVKIGALKVRNIKAEQVVVGIKAAGGRLDVAPLTANLYQGALAGTVAVVARGNRIATKQTLTGISVGPLLRDAASKDLLEGRGNVALDVTTTGATVSALKKALNGTASLALKDGAIKGVDILGIIRKAQVMLGSKTALEQQATSGEKTDFSELTGSFVIKNGVARNDDLLAKSPLIRLAGAGIVDIGDSAMNYTAKASVGKNLAQIAGVTVPVRVTGPLDNLKYSVDVAGMATDMATGAIQRELGRLGGGKASPGESGVGDRLRGILGGSK